MPRTVKELSKDDPEYLEKRAKNNEAIKRSREKARSKARETAEKVVLALSINVTIEQQCRWTA